MAETPDRLPDRVLIYTVEARHTAPGAAPSPDVASRLDTVQEAVPVQVGLHHIDLYMTCWSPGFSRSSSPDGGTPTEHTQVESPRVPAGTHSGHFSACVPAEHSHT